MQIKDPFQQEGLFRGWTPSKNPKSDPEILRLEQEAENARKKLKEMRAHGKKKRMNRLQELDALEMRRVTLAEIVKRMEKDLKEKDVYSYGDILAEVFGQRKIFAHRAIGMEALLCQLMHQMLAKQHQLKIVKKSAKKIQQIYNQHKIRYREEFHSYDALSVQLEAARLSLLALYDGVFAQQHRVLAFLKDSKADGNPSRYTIPISTIRNTKPTLTVSTKHQTTPRDLVTSSTNSWEQSDYHTAMDILDDVSLGQITSPMVKRPPNSIFLQTEKKDPALVPVPVSVKKGSAVKSARERRREIENMRQSGVVGGSLPRTGVTMSRSSVSSVEETPDAKSHRQRMRELEAVRKKLGSPRASPRVLDLETKKEDPEPKKKTAGSPVKSRSPVNSRSPKNKPIRVLEFGIKKGQGIKIETKGSDDVELRPRGARSKLKSPRKYSKAGEENKQQELDNFKKENRVNVPQAV